MTNRGALNALYGFCFCCAFHTGAQTQSTSTSTPALAPAGAQTQVTPGNLNCYTGPQNADMQKGYRNLIDTTVLLTPDAKFNAYINYDYGQNHISTSPGISASSPHWQGIAAAAHEQFAARQAAMGRFEYFNDNQGFCTGDRQAINEFTATYEYKWMSGLLSRAEYRRDWSTYDYFYKGNSEMVGAQSTLTVASISFFGPKR